MLQTNEMQSAAVFKSRLDAIICKQSIERLSERVKYSLLQKLEKGECIHKPPFGYKLLLTHRRKACDVQVSENEAPTVMQIFEMRSNGSSISDIAKVVNLKTTVVSAILKNPFYYGEMYVKSHDKYYPHKYEKIITKEIFCNCCL